MTARYKHLLVENHGKVQIIKFNNPSKKNALNLEACTEVTRALNTAAQNDSITVVVVTGVGDFYSSGYHISGFSDPPSSDAGTENSHTIIKDLVRAFFEFPKILISVVNGPCIGIAATTAALCDVVYCADTAYFYTPFTVLGLAPEGCSSYTFPRILGKSKASEMLLLNHKMYPEEAQRYNFVSEIFKPNEFQMKIWPKIVKYSLLPPETLKICKGLLTKCEKTNLEAALVAETDVLYQQLNSEEFINAIANFMRNKSKL